ncbi:MAG: hypothetical protein ACLTKQ_08270 [Acutalibacteraceae bacterium]
MPRKEETVTEPIYKMESKGLWAAQLTIGVDANGKPKRKTIYGKRQADVRAKLDTLKNELATGSVIEPDKITVAQYILSLIETDRALNQIGDNTYLRKLGSYKRIAASSIGDCPLPSCAATASDPIPNRDHQLFQFSDRQGLCPAGPLLSHCYGQRPDPQGSLCAE